MQPRAGWNIKARIQVENVCHAIVKKMSFCSGNHEIQSCNTRVAGILQNIDNLETTGAKPIGTV